MISEADELLMTRMRNGGRFHQLNSHVPGPCEPAPQPNLQADSQSLSQDSAPGAAMKLGLGNQKNRNAAKAVTTLH